MTIYVQMRTITAHKMKFPIKSFFSKCDQIRRKLRICSHLLKKSWMENFIFCAVHIEEPLEKVMIISNTHSSIQAISRSVKFFLTL